MSSSREMCRTVKFYKRLWGLEIRSKYKSVFPSKILQPVNFETLAGVHHLSSSASVNHLPGMSVFSSFVYK